MGVTRTILSPGNGKDFPKKGDEVTIEYTGNLYDSSIEPHHQGKKCVYLTSPYVDTKEVTGSK